VQKLPGERFFGIERRVPTYALSAQLAGLFRL